MQQIHQLKSNFSITLTQKISFSSTNGINITQSEVFPWLIALLIKTATCLLLKNGASPTICELRSCSSGMVSSSFSMSVSSKKGASPTRSLIEFSVNDNFCKNPDNFSLERNGATLISSWQLLICSALSSSRTPIIPSSKRRQLNGVTESTFPTFWAILNSFQTK